MKFLSKVTHFLVAVVFIVSATVLTACSAEDKTSKGAFYSLDEAYENGWLTEDDLQSIKYYHSVRYLEEKPADGVPEPLNEGKQKDIIQTYLNDIIDMPDGDLERVVAYYYYGHYNECYVLHISDTYNPYDILTVPEHEIGGVIFEDYSSAQFRVWKEKNNMNKAELLKQFDLTDEKLAFSYSGDDFSDDKVMVILKKSVSDIKIELEDFELTNGKSIELYTFGNKPNVRYILTIHLKEHGKDQVLDAVTQLNKLEFVYYASPSYLYEIADD